MSFYSTLEISAMNKNAVIGLIVVLLLVGGGFAYYQSTQTKAPESPTPATQDTMQNKSMMKEETSPTSEAASDSAMSEENNVKKFVIENAGMSFKTKQLTVNKGDTVQVTFKNTGGFHDFVIDEFNAKTKQLPAGQQETIEFVADQAGDFEFYCSVGNHRQMGMKGTLTVQ